MSERPVADSTVLIYLARLGFLDQMERVFDAVLVPEPVYAETVVRGRDEGYRDALAIDEAIGGVLVRRKLEGDVASRARELRTAAELGAGEAAAIALASDLDVRCLTDDHGARTTADAVGVDVGGTIFVLLLALDRGVLPLEAYLAAIDALTDAGFRMDADLYREARSAGRGLLE